MGVWGERLAAAYLEGLGYRILERNARTRRGELDLVARRGETLIFVEVRTRRSTAAGSPEESVDRAKLARLARLAGAYVARHPEYRALHCRIDAVAVRLAPGRAEIVHHPNVTG